jgi:hypothetical protein
MYKYAYLHGFSSSNQSRKGKQIKEYLHAMGIDLLTPSIHQPSFSQFTISDWIKYFVELDKSERAKGPLTQVFSFLFRAHLEYWLLQKYFMTYGSGSERNA